MYTITPFNIRPKFCTKWNASWSYMIQVRFLKTVEFRFLRPSRFSVALILDGFQWILPEMWSSLYKNFTSDAMQSSGNVVKKFLEIKAKNFWISGSERFLFSISWRYMITVCFWVLTSPNMIQLCWNYCQRWYSSKQKHCSKNFWRIWVFIETRRTQNLHFWSTLDAPPPVPLSPRFYLIAIGLSRDIKINALSPLPFLGKMPLHFALVGLFWGRNRAGSQVKVSERKFDICYFIHKIAGQLPVKRFWF